MRSYRQYLLIAVLLMLAAIPARAQEDQQRCVACHGDTGLSVDRNGKRVSLSVDLRRFSRSVHGQLRCVNCHPGDPHVPSASPALKGTPQGDLARKLHRPNAVALLSCSGCHPREFAQYRESIHGQAALRGNKDAPICSGCHGNHYIRGVSDPESSVHPQNVPATCASCHANQRLMARYNINTHTVTTYSTSFHGRRLELGSQSVADCSSCHGFHGILAPTDPRSPVYPANRPKTCGKPGCHPGADARFAAGFAHRIPSPKIEPLAYWVGTLYNLMVLGVATMMLVWVLFDLYRRFRNWGVHWHSPHPSELPVPPDTKIQRWDVHQRIQHILLMVSFTMLVLTGVPMLFPLSPISQALMGFAGGPEAAGKFHRAMATMMLSGGVYHLIYVAARFFRRKLGFAIFPGLQDVKDALQMARYYVGLSPEPPAYGRYTLDEKVEYWSMIWGTIVMAVTGSVLWFPLAPAKLLGAWAVDLSRIVHGYEALLAAIAIIIWHFYHAHLNPDVFPMNKTWLTGEVTAEEEAKHHPLEFREMLQSGELRPDSDGKVPKKR